MAEEKNGAPKKTEGAGQGAATPDAASAPVFSMMGQYISDLSFENPGGAAALLKGGGAPSYSVNIGVQVKKQQDDIYAIELSMNAKAERDSATLFNVELVYGGIFRVANISDQQLPPLLMIECPRQLFPFARQVLANITQAGGVPPLMLEPVNFEAIYRQNLAKMAAENGAVEPKTT